MFSKVAVAIFQNYILFQNLAIPYQEVKSIFASGFNQYNAVEMMLFDFQGQVIKADMTLLALSLCMLVLEAPDATAHLEKPDGE